MVNGVSTIREHYPWLIEPLNHFVQNHRGADPKTTTFRKDLRDLFYLGGVAGELLIGAAEEELGDVDRKRFFEWLDKYDTRKMMDEYPPFTFLAEYKEEPPEMPPALIEGILRTGHKMLVSGSSKAGKSFLLMELALAISEGSEWLGFRCTRGKVLYINLEIDGRSAVNRFYKICERKGSNLNPNILLWNLRGNVTTLEQLVPTVIRRVNDGNYGNFSAVIIDPIYKILPGDENNASDMGAFCNSLDRICTETGCSVIYCHHHSKGGQAFKKAQDRASGSGVFARDPDALLDLIELDLPDSMREDGRSAWQIESSLREFPNIAPLKIWFEFPVHRVDDSGELDNVYPEGTREANLSKTGNRTSKRQREEALDNYFKGLGNNRPVPIANIAEACKVTQKTITNRVKEFPEKYEMRNGMVWRKTG